MSLIISFFFFFLTFLVLALAGKLRPCYSDFLGFFLTGFPAPIPTQARKKEESLVADEKGGQVMTATGLNLLWLVVAFVLVFRAAKLCCWTLRREIQMSVSGLM